MELIKHHTGRGFPVLEFEDYYNAKCSIQLSSLADARAIWFGIDEVNPQVMGPSGWSPYPIPKEVLLTTRMHLTQEQVQNLLPVLQKFAETGEI